MTLPRNQLFRLRASVRSARVKSCEAVRRQGGRKKEGDSEGGGSPLAASGSADGGAAVRRAASDSVARPGHPAAGVLGVTGAPTRASSASQTVARSSSGERQRNRLMATSVSTEGSTRRGASGGESKAEGQREAHVTMRGHASLPMP